MKMGTPGQGIFAIIFYLDVFHFRLLHTNDYIVTTNVHLPFCVCVISTKKIIKSTEDS